MGHETSATPAMVTLTLLLSSAIHTFIHQYVYTTCNSIKTLSQHSHCERDIKGKWQLCDYAPLVTPGSLKKKTHINFRRR